MSNCTCKTENLSLIIHMCDDHHQLLKERGGEREREGGREGGREAKGSGRRLQLNFISRFFLFYGGWKNSVFCCIFT